MASEFKSSAERLPCFDDPAAALKKAADDGKLVLVLVRHAGDVGSLDTGHWLTEDVALKPLLDRFHRVMVWHTHPFAKGQPVRLRSGLVFLTAKGELIAIEDIPLRREGLEALLNKILRWPRAMDDLARSAQAATADAALVGRAVDVLRRAGRADQALPLQRAGVAQTFSGFDTGPSLTGAIVKGLTAELEIEARAHIADRLGRMAGLFDAFLKAEKLQDRPPLQDLRAALPRLSLSLSLGPKDAGALILAAISTGHALGEFENAPASADAEKKLRKQLGVLIPLLKTRAELVGKEAQEQQKKYAEANPGELKPQLAQLHEALRDAAKKKESEEKARALVQELLARRLEPRDSANAAGALMSAITLLELDEDRARLGQKVETELGAGRHAADVYLDLADEAFSKGQSEEAGHWWKAAEKAAGKGESPTLYRAARAMRALAEGKDSPRRSKWAKREVLDVVVLAPDMAAFAQAISRWTEKQFFPVLFQDDLYAPKFIAAFKPAQVVLARPGDPATAKDREVLSPEALRAALLASWTNNDEEGELPTRITDAVLRERLDDVGARPLGVVFGDGVSGETAGALALAAGRFQPFELLPRPRVGKDNSIGEPEHYLAYDTALDMARQVRECLVRWDLPYEDQWATITLAGRYPFRYFGERLPSGGTTYALDDMLGRDGDLTRIAVTGRLMGDHARSAYQAACSLFLQPESALLFDTYGGNAKSIWGYYRMDCAEAALKELMPVKHMFSEAANIDTFRARLTPWNSDGLLLINSSGYPDSWSVTGGDGTAEDFPVGGPCAIHMTHSGSAAELYDPDTIAGRAIWGGAFWYLGSVTEPFLTAFQPACYTAARLAAGAPFNSVFRQRSAQGMSFPWRLMMVGDPQFCLRDKPAKRKPVKRERLEALLPGEILTAESSANAPVYATPSGTGDAGRVYAEWMSLLRCARWCGDRATAARCLEKMPGDLHFTPADLPIVLEEHLIAGNIPAAVKLWSQAPEEARKIYASRIYARYAIGHLMDKALAGKEAGDFYTRFAELLTTGPAKNFVARWLDKLAAVAKEKKEEDALIAWLAARGKDAQLAHTYQVYFAAEALSRKPVWTAEDKTDALKNFTETVKSEKFEERLQGPFKTLTDQYLAKVPNATPEQLIADVKALFAPDSASGKNVQPLLADLEVKRTLHKDWLVLGAFKDQAAGAWEKVGPAADKTRPDFAATFQDGDRKLSWKRPFKPEGFGIVNLKELLKPNENVCAYAAGDVEAEKDVEAVLLLGSDDGATVWLDGRQIHRTSAQRGVRVDEDKVAVKLTAGTHSLVLRIDQSTGGWGFCARFADAAGKPLAGVKLRCPPEK